MEDKEIKIIKLDWNTAIRTRAGMYIGSTENPSVLLREAIDNSVDELYGSERTTKIFIKTSDENSPWNVVADNGRGIPIQWDSKHKMTSMELACTSTHTGSKFDKDDVAIGLNGVGISATNALSSDFVMLSRITDHNARQSIPDVEALYNQMVDDGYYFIHFSKGKKIVEGAIRYGDVEFQLGFSFPKGMSTITAFIPDDKIFDDTTCKIPVKNLTYVVAIMSRIYKRSVYIEVNGSLLHEEFNPYQYEFIKKISAQNTNGDVRDVTFYVNFETDKMMNTSDFSGSINSLVVNRGMHIEVVKSAYSEALKSIYNLNYSSVLCGIRMNIIVVAAEVDFSSQTKERCTKIEGFNEMTLAKQLIDSFKKIINSNKEVFDVHVDRLSEYIASLTKISTINRIKNAIGTIGGNSNRVRSKIPKSVRDASVSNRKLAELYICEGRSAGASILNTRDARTQAILELRGVPMNAIDKSLDEILDNEEMNSLIAAIGVGVNEYHDLKLARYGKIIIAADADSDGGRIASLVLGIIAKKMTFLINERMVYVLRSPLYIQGDNYIYPEDADQLDRNKPYTRIKGLGELNEDQASVIITNPDTRRLLQITNENCDEALKLLTMTSARKHLMIEEGVVIDPYNLGLWY